MPNITQLNLDESPTKPVLAMNRMTTNLGRELSIIESESIGETEHKPSFVDRVNTMQKYNLDQINQNGSKRDLL